MRTLYAFASKIGALMTSYVTLKQALGRRFGAEVDVLAHLDHFLVAQRHDASTLTPESFASWCLTLDHLKATVRRGRMRVVRNLCLYVRRTDPACFVPDPACFPTPHESIRPHIFSEDQIVRLLRLTGELTSASTSPLRAEVFRLAIVLL